MASRFETTEKQELRRLAKSELRQLRDGPSLQRAMDAAAGLQSSFDEIASRAPERTKWECASGCSYCCHMPVHLTAVEAVRLTRHVLAEFDEAERRAASERLTATAEAISKLSESEFKNSRTPCALLDDDGRCSVYAARPMACRGFHSTSVDTCKKSFETNETRCDEARDRTTEDLCARMAIAMHAVARAGGLDSSMFELNSAMAPLLRLEADAAVEDIEDVKDVACALEGVRCRPSPLDVPLAAIVARFRNP